MKLSNRNYTNNKKSLNSPDVSNFSKATSNSNTSIFLGSGYISNFFTNMEELSTEENITESESDILAKQALVAVEGSYKDSNGREHSFSPDRLETIAQHTNKALEKGVVIPLCTDHKKEFNNTVGSVDGHAYVKRIEEKDLPNKKAVHLIGKTGLFLDNVHVKDEDAARKVKSGIVTSVSMGLNLDPTDHRLVELSLVPIPAIPNMGLFGVISEMKNMSNFALIPSATNTMDDNNIFTWEDLETNEQTLDDLKEEYDNLTEKLWKLLQNIYSSESADISDVNTLKQYIYTVLNGFSIRVVDTLGLSQVPDSPVPGEPGALSADQAMDMQQTQAQDINNTGVAPMGLGIGKAVALFQQKANFQFASGLLPYAKLNKVSKYMR